MNVRVSFKNYRSSIPQQFYANQKSEKLGKFLDGNCKVSWSLSIEKKKRIAHCKITGKGIHIFSEATSQDMEESIDTVASKLEAQLRKIKEKSSDHHHGPQPGISQAA